MNIAITGDKGFIGTHLKRALKKEEFKIFPFKGDFFNINSLNKFVQGKDVIIHLAAINRGPNSAIITGNIGLTCNLVTALQKSSSESKMIYSSSIQANTDCLYGQAKRLTEVLLESYSQEFQVPVTVFRITNVFGEQGKPFYNSVVATFCYQATHNQRLIINKKNQKLCLIYVQDVVKHIKEEIKMQNKKLFSIKPLISPAKTITIGKLAQTIESFKKINSSLKEKPSEGTFYKNLYNTYLWYYNHPQWH